MKQTIVARTLFTTLLLSFSILGLEASQDFSNIVEQTAQQKPRVTLKTALPIGSKIKLKLKYENEIALTGVAEMPSNNQEQEYTITAQSILIEGVLP